MKKNTKIILVSLSLLASSSILTSVASPVLAADEPLLISSNTTAQTQTKVTMKITKSGSHTPSEAAAFLGNYAQISLGKNGEVRIHVDGNVSSRTKGQDMSKMISSLTLNGIKGSQDNVAKDGSSLDYVFPISAYKAGKGEIEFTLNVMGHTMNEKADIYFGKLTNNKKAASTKKDLHVKRRLKHNAYIYKRNGKRANKKTLKKGKRIVTYGKAIKLHGKYFYKISKTHYVKKANF